VKLYPQRKRCLKCRKFFGPLVVAGLYCSYTCRGGEVPRRGVDTPRQCRRQGGKPKRAYMSEAEAQAAAEELGDGLTAYQCFNCQLWHIGHDWTKASGS
jgi:hypothetical protein